jgi:hypothetical protein
MKLRINEVDQTVSSKALAARKPTEHKEMIKAIKLAFSNIGQNLDGVAQLHEGIQVVIDDRGYTAEIILSVKNAVFIMAKWDDKLRMQVMDELEAAKAPKVLSQLQMISSLALSAHEANKKIIALEDKSKEYDAILNRSGAPFGFMSIGKFTIMDKYQLSKAVYKKIAVAYNVETKQYMATTSDGFEVATKGYHIDELRDATATLIVESNQISRCYILHPRTKIKAKYIK